MNLRTQLILCLALLFGAYVHATTIRALSLNQKVKNADRIVVAEVLRQETIEGQVPGRLYTLTTLQVIESLKGELKTKNTFVVRQIGGTKGTWTQEVIGDAKFKTAERAVLFLRYDAAQDVHFLVALSQGKVSLERAIEPASTSGTLTNLSAHAMPERSNGTFTNDGVIERVKALLRVDVPRPIKAR